MASRPAFLFAGAVGGFLIGYMTRPDVMGVKVPFGLLFSSHPADAPFRSELASHLGVAIAIGLVAAWVLHMVVAGKGLVPTTSATNYDRTKWQALAELDADIAKAAETARAKDAECEAVLARKYLALNDKAYLETALNQALEDYDVREQKRRDRDAVSIQWAPARMIGGVQFRRGVVMSKHGESKLIVQGGVWSIDEGYMAGSNFDSEEELRTALAEGQTS